MNHVSAAITGIGLVTPAGLGRASNWNTITRCAPTVRQVDELKEARAPIDFAATVPFSFDADRLLGRKVTNLYDRATQYALVAAHAALTDAGLDSAARAGARVGVVIGTAMGGARTFEFNHQRLLTTGPKAINARFLPKGLVNMTSGVLAIELSATGPNMVVSTACASGATAIGTALALLRSNQCDVVVCGGTDASVTPLHVSGFHKLHALSRALSHSPQEASCPFDEAHDGFVMAEGAGILVLERPRDAYARRADPYAHVSGYAATADAYHVTAPHPQGLGAKAAIHQACHDAELTPGEIGHVNAHATSTPTGDAVEAKVLADLTPQAAIASTKGVTGHTMGAAGAIEAAYTAIALSTQTVPPTAHLHQPIPEASALDLVTTPRRKRFHTALSTSFGFGGHNAVLALTA